MHNFEKEPCEVHMWWWTFINDSLIIKSRAASFISITS